jgi:hypothetical protein
MRLFEEYLQRHKITDVPMVHHCSVGTLVLRSVDPVLWKNKWAVVSIVWKVPDFRPGHYLIQINYPIHNGYLTATNFTKNIPIEKKWHEYEDFVLDWVSSLKGLKPIVGSQEKLLTAWEMFVFVYDGWFVKQPADIKVKLFNTLNKENSIETRYLNYKDIVIFLSTHYPAVMRTWKYEFLGGMQTYADWLACLIEKKSHESEEKGILQS